MRRLLFVSTVVLILVGVIAPHAQPTRAGGHGHDHDTATMDEFVALVRGYDVATIRRTFPAYNTGLFERIFGAGTPIPLSTAHDRAIFDSQLVRAPSGRVLDIGHVITGLEAAAPLPPAARQVEMISGCQMRAAVTWSGDVGQALIDFVLAGAADPGPFYDGNAPEEDLYGDIDGYVLGAEYGGPAIDVAAVLDSAYLNSTYEATRFGRFLAALGDDAEALIAREITCYARSFAALSGRPVDAARIAAAAPYFTDRFITFVQDGLASEGG